MKNRKIERITAELKTKYFNYYATIYHSIIKGAVKRAVRDLGVYEVDTLHRHITHNYIYPGAIYRRGVIV